MILLKAIVQVQRFVHTLLKNANSVEKIKPQNLEPIIESLTTGRITHDCPIAVEEATELGLPISMGLPRSIYDLMDLYSQPRGGCPAVRYIPMPYDRRPALPEPKGRPLQGARIPRLQTKKGRKRSAP